MGRGDMNFRDLERSEATGNALLMQDSSRRGVKFTALTLMLVVGVLLLGAIAAWAKDHQPTTRTISGTVYDQSENSISGASVELTDVQTGKVLDIYSNEAGQYQYTDLRFDHDYTVKGMYKGLSSEMRHISILETRWTLVLNLTIPIPKSELGCQGLRSRTGTKSRATRFTEAGT